MTENTSPNLPHQFQKGQSGNPAGKPKGARHKATLMAERLMQDDVGEIVRAVVTAARNGDMMAAKIILDRSLRCGAPIHSTCRGSKAGMTLARRVWRSWMPLPTAF